MGIAASTMPDELEAGWRALGLWQDLSLADALALLQRLRGKRGEHFLAHSRPLLAAIDQCLCRFVDQALPGVLVMMVMVRSGHGADIVGLRPVRKP